MNKAQLFVIDLSINYDLGLIYLAALQQSNVMLKRLMRTKVRRRRPVGATATTSARP